MKFLFALFVAVLAFSSTEGFLFPSSGGGCGGGCGAPPPPCGCGGGLPPLPQLPPISLPSLGGGGCGGGCGASPCGCGGK